MKTLLIGGMAAFAMAGVAVAQEAPGARWGDTDGDQRISREEFLARHLERFDRGDQNRDGTVTGEEMRAAFSARRDEMRGRIFDRLDADSDGAISRAEFEAQAERREGRRGRRGHHRRGGRGWGHAEIAADGVTRAEAEARATAWFARMDANGDGYVSREDGEARRAARHGARRGGAAE